MTSCSSSKHKFSCNLSQWFTFLPPSSSRLLFLLLLFLAHDSFHGLVLGQGVVSPVIVLDPAGGEAGPQITLSATVLVTNERLKYTCIEGTDAEDNRLSRILDTGGIREFGLYSTRVCNYAVDKKYWCTVVSGEIAWKREYGGKYCCSASPDEWYYVHWIDPKVLVSSNTELSGSAYGSEQKFHCSVDITPTEISYKGILTVSWEWIGSATRFQWSTLDLSNEITSTITEEGANATLTIRNYNPIKHGGDYRCQATVLRYPDHLTSPPFKITSKPMATLKNSQRPEFIFGLYERNVKFSCEALSYPFPERIEFKLQSVVLNGDTKGVRDYESDVLSINVDVHKATFIVNNMSEVFQNDSVFECRVFRKNDPVAAIAQKRIIMFDDAPPVVTTTPVYIGGPPPTNNENKNTKKTKPWVIALAVIIPIIIILLIVVLVWKWRKRSYHDDGGNTYYQAPANDLSSNLSRGYHSSSRNTLHSQKDPTYAGHYSSQYAQSKIHHNPLYGSRPPGSSCYGQASGVYGQASGVYDTPTPTGSLPRQSRPGTMTREHQAGSLPRQPVPGSMPGPHDNGYSTSMYAKPQHDAPN